MKRILIATDGSEGSCAAVEEGVQLALEVGAAVTFIAQAARGWSADLVVVGSRGLGTVAGAVIGSVSRGLVSCSPAPVMVVRTSARAGAIA